MRHNMFPYKYVNFVWCVHVCVRLRVHVCVSACLHVCSCARLCVLLTGP